MAGQRTSVQVTLDPRMINPMLVRVTDLSARRAAGRTRDRAKANLVAAGRIDTGRLLNSISARRTAEVGMGPSPSPLATTYAVGTPVFYAGFQEHGIGPVYPRKAKVLRFRPKGSSVFIFRPMTRGFPGAHYLRDAYRALTLKDYLP